MVGFVNCIVDTSFLLGKMDVSVKCDRKNLVPRVRRSAIVGRSEELKVDIERPASNKRKIASQIVINKPTTVVWRVLTDYNRLAEFIPNLAMSRRRFHPQGGIRLEQCGVQSILGFEFKASVVLDMTEVNADKKDRDIRFKMHESRDFKEFEGVWKLRSVDKDRATSLSYEVSIVPKGFVPVQAVEWRIKEDVPVNLKMVKRKSESMSVEEIQESKALSPGKDVRGEAPRC